MGDDQGFVVSHQRLDISIHIPRVGDDYNPYMHSSNLVLFQSTSPVWGMTIMLPISVKTSSISIHIPRVGDDPGFVPLLDENTSISIHIPRVGDDFSAKYAADLPGISIHIPRVGDDACATAPGASSMYFNPHPPCGG